ADVERRDGTAERDGIDGVVTVIGIEHEPGFRADRHANGTDERDVLLKPEPDLEFHRSEALPHVSRNFLRDIREWITGIAAVSAGRVSGDGGAQRPAHELMDRGAEPL